MLFGIERRDPAAAAFVEEGGGAYSYGRLCRDARGVAAAAGGRRLAFCLCENSYAGVCGYLGLMEAGAVPLLLDAQMPEKLLAGLLDCYRPALVWLPLRLAEGVPGRRVHALGGYLLLEREEPPCGLHPDLRLLLTTSGSTGSPKLVRQSARNVESNARAIAAYLEIGPDERAVTTLPMHYTYGLSILHSHLLAGACVLLTGRSVLERGFWEFFGREGATSLGGVPYTYEMLSRAGFFEREWPSLRYFTQAGGKLPEEMHRRCAEYAAAHGKRFYVMYGQTEATARMGYLPWRMALEKQGSMGIAIPGGAFTLIGADGAEIDAPDTVGELVYRGDNVTMGYAEALPDLAKGDERGGVLATGDMARRDADGYYYIVGRKKRFLKLFGRRVSLDGCERLLKERFPGLDCACLGRDDLLRVFITDGALAAEARDYLAGVLGVHRRAVEVRAVGEIPRSSAGKTLYRALEEPE